MKPRIGDDVHYVSYGTPGGEYTSTCRAAKVTALLPPTGLQCPDHGGDCPPDVRDYMLAETVLRGPQWHGKPGRPAGAQRVDLCVFNPTGLFFKDAEQDEEEKRGGTWHWPEDRRPCDCRPATVVYGRLPTEQELADQPQLAEWIRERMTHGLATPETSPSPEVPQPGNRLTVGQSAGVTVTIHGILPPLDRSVLVDQVDQVLAARSRMTR